ncbi:MAG: hypothetical protein JXR51_03045 [Bacteroidales bacterium]|nr:hypothetical protein [Bacteroidales bacterium]MBN2756127.1 hypothetical protein [Bacteroidales bacterium]
METKESNSQKTKSTIMLKNAVIDAERLLAYAAEFGIKVSEKHIKSIVESKNREQTNNWTEKEEIDFWIAFQTLSKIVQPVSVDSIRASSEPLEKAKGFWSIFKSKKSIIKRSVRWYTIFALISMLIMIALQVYSIIGTSLLTKITQGNERMLEIEKRMQALVLITSSNVNDRTAMMEQNSLEIENGEKANEVDSGIQLLADWLNFTYNIWSREYNKINESVASGNNQTTDGPPNFTGAVASNQNIVVIQQAKSLLIILNQYILPLLYGLFGGFAFVLRSISAETKNMTFTPASNIKFGLRIHLGALAGLVVGFLWGDFDSKSFGIINSLSPLAVAFLAGYSVEFLFKSLDSLIGTTDKKVNTETVIVKEEKTNE